MKQLFTIGLSQHECGGHGDNYQSIRILRTGAYESGSYPPVFTTPEKAKEWGDKNLPYQSPVVVTLELQD